MSAVSSSSNFAICSHAAFNIAASVSIILVNKQIMTGCGFEYLSTLLFLNFASTAAVLEVLRRFRCFEVKHLPQGDRWLLSLMATFTVLLNNASNEANSVGLFQIAKLMVVPTVIFLEESRKPYSSGVLGSIGVATVGVAIATVSDFQVNSRGSMLACASVLCTGQYQMWQASKQHEHRVSAIQITYSVGWPQVLVSLAVALLLDVVSPDLKALVLLQNRGGSLLGHQFRGWADFWWLGLGCGLAVAVNVSAYALLGKTSPVTFQVINQLKTCLIVAFGYIFFDAQVPLHWLLIRFAGVAVAISGIISYAVCKNQDSKRQKVM